MKPVTSRRALLGATAAALAGGTILNAAAIIAAKADDLAKFAKPNDRMILAAKEELVGQVGQAKATAADPIFAAIERHRAALLRFLDATRAIGLAVHRKVPKKVARNYNASFDAIELASADLIEIIPTTLAGAAALLDYTVKVATGRVVLADDPNGRFRSGIWCLPESPSPDDGFSLYPFDVMANALQAMIELKVIA